MKRTEATYHLISSWSETDWMCAAFGELGEAANLIKKRRRRRKFGAGAALVGVRERASRARVAEELADTIIYLDLLATRMGINLAEAVKAKFNKTSRKMGSAVRLR